MPREHRRIELCDREVSDAIRSFRRINPDAVPAGVVKSYEVKVDGGAEIQFEQDDGSQRFTARLEPATIVQILVRFCIETNVPIARMADKRAEVCDYGVALVMDLEEDQIPEAFFDLEDVV